MTPFHKPPTDTSDKHYADVCRACYTAYDEYLTTGTLEALDAWIKLDREKSDILYIRQHQKQGREIGLGTA